LYFRQAEHNPPYFHAKIGNDADLIDIQTLAVLDGKLPSRAAMLVKAWALQYQAELLNIWNTQQFLKIQPLD
jgi:hypothetical protein